MIELFKLLIKNSHKPKTSRAFHPNNLSRNKEKSRKVQRITKSVDAYNAFSEQKKKQTNPLRKNSSITFDYEWCIFFISTEGINKSEVPSNFK